MNIKEEHYTSFFGLLNETLIKTHCDANKIKNLCKNKIDSIEDIVTLKDQESWNILWSALNYAFDDNEKHTVICGKHSKTLNTENQKTKGLNQTYIQSIIEGLPEYIYWKDVKRVYRGCNRRVSEYLNLESPKDIIGKSDYDFNWNQERIDELHRIDNLILQGVSNVIEDKVPRENDTDRIMLTNKSPLYDSEGNIIGILGLSTDITELKETQKDLEIAKNHAEMANKAKSDFIANMSHDIRSPIIGMLSLADSLYHQATNSKTRSDARTLIDSTNELLRLLNEILEVSQIESGRIESVLEPFEIAKVIEQNLNLLKPNYQDKSLKVRSFIDTRCPKILYGDRWHFNRIVLNLLSNAIKFTEKGSINVILSVYECNDERVQLKLRVKDTGIGIPEEKHEEIFEHFSRLAPSYEGNYEGSGLGLYTIKHYVELLNGTVEVKSKLGEGSEFIISLGFGIAKESDLPEDQHALNAWVLPTEEIDEEWLDDSEIKAESMSARVLVVEDSNIAAAAAEKLLRDLHCDVDRSSNGKVALQCANENNYDLIFMDIGLPDTTGLAVTEQIRKFSDKQKAAVPIVALTGHMGNAERQACLKSGMNEMLIKPMNQVTAKSILKRFVFTQEGSEKDFIDYVSDHLSDVQLSDYNEKNREKLPIIDLEDGVRLTDGNEDLAREFLQLFAHSIREDSEKLRTILSSKDLDKLYDEAHRIYGTVLYVGTPRLRNDIKVFQDLVHEKKPQDELESTYLKLRQSIEEYLDAMKESEI